MAITACFARVRTRRPQVSWGLENPNRISSDMRYSEPPKNAVAE